MLIYDFKCRKCGRVSEIFFRSSNDKAVRCPNCSSTSTERLMPSSFLVEGGSEASGETCCGRTERCEAPACSTGNTCRRD